MLTASSKSVQPAGSMVNMCALSVADASAASASAATAASASASDAQA